MSSSTTVGVRGLLWGQVQDDHYVYYNMYSTRISRNVKMCVLPLVFIIGIIGNILIVLVCQHKDIRSMPSRPYLIALAGIDTIGLVCLLEELLDNLNYQIKYNSFTCKLWDSLAYYTITASAWVVVALTVDRYICVAKPLQARNIRTKHRIAVVAIIFLTSFLFNLHIPIAVRCCDSTHKRGVCVYSDDGTSNLRALYFEYFYANARTSVNLAVNFVLPLCVIIFSNVAIIRITRKSSAEFGKERSASSGSDSMTRALVIVSVFFVVLMVPKNIGDVLQDWVIVDHLWEPNDQQRMYATWDDITWICQHTNNAINFYVYCLAGAKFRLALKSIVMKCSFN